MAKWGDDCAFAEAFENARRAAGRALAIEPELAEAHMAMAKVQMGYDWDWRAADASLRRALALAPAHASIWVAAGVLAVALGQRDRAILLGRRAVYLGPGLVGAHQVLGVLFLVVGEWEG